MDNTRQLLSKKHADTDDVGIEWDADNQQWWDWYMSLAANEDGLSNATLTEVNPPEDAPIPKESDLDQQLRDPYTLTPQQIESFQRDGYIKLKQVLSPGALTLLRQQMTALLNKAEERLGSRFGSLEMMWLENAIIKKFVFSERLARLAAELLGVSAIRLYHDNALSKKPGCGRTPWHYDGHHFPIATDNVCTVWIPLQPIIDCMGPLGFAKGLDVLEKVKDIPFNKFDVSYDKSISERFREHHIEVDMSPFDLGEVSFHHNLNFHTAGPNLTNAPRMVLATTYFEDGARVIDAPHMINGDWRRFMPNLEPGDVIETSLNPVLFNAHEQ